MFLSVQRITIKLLLFLLLLKKAISLSTPILYDMPVSNNGARVRLIIRAKGLDKRCGIKIVPPSDIGGLKSESYLRLNPQGKMPLLVEDGFAIPESDTICRHLIDSYQNYEPSFEPADRALRCLSNQICR